MDFIFYIANTVHLAALCLLICDILMKKSAAGISGRTQLLLFFVFLSRYADLFTNFISYYNSINKILFIMLTLLTVGLIHSIFPRTYDRHNDSFVDAMICIPTFMLALIFNDMTISGRPVSYDMQTFIEILWTFSMFLEALAIIPQYFMSHKSEHGRRILPYVSLLATYRSLYLVHWIIRYMNEGFIDIISAVSGTVQTIILMMMILHIGLSKQKKNNWKQITEVFTAEASKLGGKDKADGDKDVLIA